MDRPAQAAFAMPSYAERIRIRCSRAGEWIRGTRAVRRVSLALLDQALFSASNFFLGILLARWLGHAEYGSFALAFSIFLLVSLAYQSLITEPMGVFGPSNYATRLREYVGVMVKIHVPLSVLTGVVLIACGGAALAQHDGSLYWALIATAVAGPCVLWLRLGRRAFYLEFAPGPAAIGTAVYCALLLAGLAAVAHAHLVSPVAALLLMGVAGLVAGTLMIWRFRPQLRGRQFGLNIREVFGEHWHYGKWALAASICAWVPMNVFYGIITQAHGIAEAGRLRALNNFMLPAAQAQAALTMLAIPFASRLWAERGQASLSSVGRTIALLYGGGTAVYWAVIIALGPQVVSLLYHGNYPGIVRHFPWLAVGSVLSGASFGPCVALRANQTPRDVFYSYGVGAMITPLAGYPLVLRYGVAGAVFTFVLASAAVVAVGFLLLHWRVAKSREFVVVPAPAQEPPAEAA